MGSDMAPKLPGTREGGRGKGEGKASGWNAEQLSGFAHRGNERVDVVFRRGVGEQNETRDQLSGAEMEPRRIGELPDGPVGDGVEGVQR